MTFSCTEYDSGNVARQCFSDVAGRTSLKAEGPWLLMEQSFRRGYLNGARPGTRKSLIIAYGE